MIRSNRLFSVLLVTAVAACGGDDNPATPDAGMNPTEDAGPVDDAAPDPDAPVQPAGCDFTEAADATNDTYYAEGTPENAGTLATTWTVCGQVDNTHFDPDEELVDIDAFTVTVPAGPLYATLSGPGLENLDEVVIAVYGGSNFTTYLGDGLFFDGYAMFELPNLPAGTYEFAMLSFATAAPAAATPYKIQFHVDTRCPKITADADHTEGTDDGANNAFVVDYSADPAIAPTPEDTDAPETTGLTVGTSDAKRITATLAEVPVVGSYKDADTFAFTTGADVTEVQVRLNWTGMNDLDWYLLDTNGEEVSSAAFIGEGEDEYRTIRVEPDTTYWLWTGLYEEYTGPTPYDLSICGSRFEP